MKAYKIKFRPAKKAGAKTTTGVVIYNQYTGQLFVADETYDLQDGDVIQTDDTYYLGGSDPVPSPPPPPDDFYVYPVADPTQEVMCYYSDPVVTDPNYAGDPAWTNYPEDPPPLPAAPPADPGYVEIDPSYFESYDEYYDEGDEPVYSGSDCDGSIGIRG
jgi:hypothetical protein|uniref:hypothetical protein n=1 Tax=Prosthecobacter sp. TaxID=1965333 RepID=UPI003784C3BA